MTPVVRPAAVLVVALLAAAQPARAGFLTYAFTTDSSDRGGSLTGSFRVDQADLLDGVLTSADVRDYVFVFTDPAAGTTAYTLGGVFPDLAVNPATGVPTGFDGSVLGDQVGDAGVAQAQLTALALTPNASFWTAITRPTEETDAGFGHWTIAEEVANPVPAPTGAVLFGLGMAAAARLIRRRTAAA